MEKDFDRWKGIKKQLAHDVPPPLAFPKNGEVWMCTLGKNLGREQDGGSSDFSRPVLVVKNSTTKFSGSCRSRRNKSRSTSISITTTRASPPPPPCSHNCVL